MFPNLVPKPHSRAPAQLSVTCSTEKRERAWYLPSHEHDVIKKKSECYIEPPSHRQSPLVSCSREIQLDNNPTPPIPPSLYRFLHKNPQDPSEVPGGFLSDTNPVSIFRHSSNRTTCDQLVGIVAVLEPPLRFGSRTL